MAVDELQLPLAGLPDGVVAQRIRRMRTTDDGEQVEVLVGKRLRRTDEVELIAPAAGLPGSDLDPADALWLLGASRRQWKTAEGRYGPDAWPRALTFVRAGAIRLRCRIDDSMRLGEPQSWTLTEEWKQRRIEAGEQRRREHGLWRARAADVAIRVAEGWPDLAAALSEVATTGPGTRVLIFAAEDLADGVIHAGPRAFSQAHFGHTKARDDVAEILTRAGLADDVLVALGIRRSARIGVAGPLNVVTAGQEVALSVLPGPVLVRVHPELTLRLTRPAPLVVVENLQAAETLADQLQSVSVIYSAGFPGDETLRLIAGVASAAERVVVVPDADLGGVRIAERILSVMPGAPLIDIGAFDHPRRARWPDGGVSTAGLRAALHGPAASLAASCLQRGYPVEQELATVDAVRATLAAAV